MELFIVFGFRRSSRCQRRECFGRVVQWLNGFRGLGGWDGAWCPLGWGGCRVGRSTAQHSTQPTVQRRSGWKLFCPVRFDAHFTFPRSTYFFHPFSLAELLEMLSLCECVCVRGSMAATFLVLDFGLGFAVGTLWDFGFCRSLWQTQGNATRREWALGQAFVVPNKRKKNNNTKFRYIKITKMQTHLRLKT